MKTQTKTRNALDGEIIKLRRGLAIYKVAASPFYRVRIRTNKDNKYIVRSTKETSTIEARKAAENFAQSLSASGQLTKTPKEYTFEYWSNQSLKDAAYDVSQKTRNRHYVRDLRYALEQKNWGLLKEFSIKDVREIQTKDFVNYIRQIQQQNPSLSSSIHLQLRSCFRRVMKTALYAGVISSIPDAPKLDKKKKQTPRTYFRFRGVVAKERDEYKRLLDTADKLAKDKAIVRGKTITHELRDIILFLAHSFVRPTTTELYALKHSDVETSIDPETREKCLLLSLHSGKTGSRTSATTEGAVSVYKRIKERYPNATDDDYLFLPEYKNRDTAVRIVQRQFNHLLGITGLKKDETTGRTHTLYSMRHTALAMRLVNSGGKINTFLLAKNAGTSEEMLRKFYLSILPPTKSTIRNLQIMDRD